MIIPFYEEFDNQDKNHGIFDLYPRDKKFGMITPEGNSFIVDQSGHDFYEVGIMLQAFMDYRLSFSFEDTIKYIEETKKYILNSKRSNKIILINILDFLRKYDFANSEFMKRYLMIGGELSRDYLVQLFNYDYVEKIYKTITTSKKNIYEIFFNYLLMEFNIRQISSVGFNPNINDFGYIEPNCYIEIGTEREYKEEIELIKKYIPYYERYKYFK